MTSVRATPVRVAASLAIVAAAIAVQALLPELPPFVLLWPGVIGAALVGGAVGGGVALILAAAFSLYGMAEAGYAPRWRITAAAAFLLGGVILIALVRRLNDAMQRFSRERQRLEAALRTADAALWEISPGGKLFWDDNFYRLVGLDPASTPPDSKAFLDMIHPEDRSRMAAARRLMNEGQSPPAVDEYRLKRPDGREVWLENSRTRVTDESGDYFIGITHDITRRKLAEERVTSLLLEADHRAKNQFMVIGAMARETLRLAKSPADFEATFAERLQAFARSHDLMVRGDWKGVTLKDLLKAHLEPFGATTRAEIACPDIVLSPHAAQYLGIAFHELATNAVKHGSLTSEEGGIRVEWSIEEKPEGAEIELTWMEFGSNPPATQGVAGFGARVLSQLVPSALSGHSSREITPAGMVWKLCAPISSVSAAKAASIGGSAVKTTS